MSPALLELSLDESAFSDGNPVSTVAENALGVSGY